MSLIARNDGPAPVGTSELDAAAAASSRDRASKVTDKSPSFLLSFQVVALGRIFLVGKVSWGVRLAWHYAHGQASVAARECASDYVRCRQA
jgi:hypothetical protein